jgi:hypothetical protein
MNLNTLNGGTVATKTWLNPVCSNLSCNIVTLDQNSAGGVPPAGFSLLYADNADRLKVAAPAAPIETLAYLSDLVAPISSSEIVSVDLSSKVQCLNGSEIKASTDNIDRIIIDNAKTGLYTKNVISGPSGAFLSLNNNGTFALNSRFVDNGGVDCTVNRITVVGPQAKSSIELTDATVTTGLFNGFSRINREIMDASSQTFLDGNQVERIKITNSGVVINNAYELPPTAGAANTIITSNGLGGTSWQAPVTPQVYGLFSQTAVQTVANTITETTLISTGIGSLTVPPLYFQNGYSFLYKTGGTFRDSANGQTIRFRLRNSGVLFDSGVLILSNVNTARGWNIDVQFTYYGGNIITNFQFSYTDGNNDSFGFNNQGTNAINNAVANTLDFTVQWGAASAQNTISSNYGTLTKIF